MTLFFAWLLRIFVTILGLFSAIFLVLWTLHAFGVRLERTSLVFGTQFLFAITDTGYTLGWGTIRWFLPQGVFEPLIGLLGVVAAYFFGVRNTLVKTLPSNSDADSTTTPKLKMGNNRDRMLARVENYWVKGVLLKSLYAEARLNLGMEYDSTKIENPWSTIVQRPNQAEHSLPVGKPLIELFDECQGQLLILGAPGAGKTTLLLELARDLIVRAKADGEHPIPVIFHLSTWAIEREPLNNWMVKELRERYSVPKQQAEQWVEANTILPLLDGLDEMAKEYRNSCVDAINVFHSEHGFVPIAVCSRLEDYKELSIKLGLREAVVIRSLNQQQVVEYLKGLGRSMNGVRAALRDDAELREVVDNPLMLSIVALTYRDKTPVKVRATGTVEERRKEVFDDYVKEMFHRRVMQYTFENKQVIVWLEWLASQLVSQRQTVFYLEWLTPNLLPKQRLVVFFNYIFKGYMSLTLGGIFGLFFIPIAVLIMKSVIGVAVGFVIGMIISLITSFSDDSSFEINVTQALSWSWKNAFEKWYYGIVLIVVSGLSAWFEGAGLANGVLAGFALYTIITIVSGLEYNELSNIITPNQGIIRWAVLGSYTGVFTGIVVAIGVSLFFGLFYGVVYGSAIGLYIGCIFGYREAVIHYTVRFLLSANNYLPYRLVPFLDHCVDRIFLRRVGGGYIFVHRLLMEHFASLDTTAVSTSSTHPNSSET